MSPKEVCAFFGSTHIVLASIASPKCARNIKLSQRVCATFIDVFVQKGFKVAGGARYVKKAEPDFAIWAAPLEALAGQRFPVRNVFVVEVIEVEPIVAPSYRMYAAESTEGSQVAAAMLTYDARPACGDA